MKLHFAFLGVLCAHALARDEGDKALRAAATTTEAIWDYGALRTDLKSALFGKCITAANTRKMKYFSIDGPEEGTHFVKYEVSRFATGLRPVKWDKEIQCKGIFDCSKASKDYLMFQYDGQTCRMATTPYFAKDSCFCDGISGYKKDLVYVNYAIQTTGCPANTDVLVGKNGSVCIGGTQLAVPFDYLQAGNSCGCHYGDSHVYDRENAVDFTTIRNYMRDKNYQGEFFVDVYYGPDETYRWNDGAVVNNSYIAGQPQGGQYQQQAVISSSHDYLLVMKYNMDMITGFLCIGDIE